ncbi:hypothetical protein [Methylobacterium planeticum]|uniref:Uncharacterized protein n=1 Tax=Methylobacterium planeticum TaxID=2615211 RepID=A0A6N6MX88_9HYPH|nr:hypothetical protein [Methylobacterium planeticum]KAB1075336.1 hypothetical protein F6X51_05505 [Methylobacterium planeticum]
MPDSAAPPSAPHTRTAFAEAAARRRALFTARDALSAEILGGAVTRADATCDQGSPGVPPLEYALPKPVRPRSWLARRSYAAKQRARRDALLSSGLFDPDWYRARYPDIETAGMDPLQHFLDHGSFEGRSPGPDFNVTVYLALNPDVVAEPIEPWMHYTLHGRAEGRATK